MCSCVVADDPPVTALSDIMAIQVAHHEEATGSPTTDDNHGADHETGVGASVSDESKDHFALEQWKDPEVREILEYTERGKLPENVHRARRLVSEGSVFVTVDGVLYYIDPRRGNRRRVVVPKQLRRQILEETHSSRFAGHFSGRRLYVTLVLHWWWRGMSQDAADFVRSCPECAVATGARRRNRPPLQPIPVSRPFQILGIDVMDLPPTERGNRHVVVVQDLFTKWPIAFAVPDQKTKTITRLLAGEVVPCFGVPEALLSDRGDNLLSHLMTNLCEMLGVQKLNTTAYHPQCDEAVKRFNQTLKTALRKHTGPAHVESTGPHTCQEPSSHQQEPLPPNLHCHQ
jgi:hypothetical protein